MSRGYVSARGGRFAESLCAEPRLSRRVWHAWAVRCWCWQLSRSLGLRATDHFALFDDVNDWMRRARWTR